MRETGLYQIYDTVGQTVIGPILTAPHPAAATRNFTDLLRDPKTTLAQHPDDFKLIRIGTQDEETGTINAATEPIDVLTGTQWKLSTQTRDKPELAAD